MFLKRLIYNDLLKNILVVFSGNMIAQLIPFLGSIIIARIYTPEDIGQFAFIVVIINTIVLISDLKLGERLIIVKSEKEKKKIIEQSIILILITSTLSLLPSYYVFYKDLGFFSLTIPLIIFITSISNLFLNYTISIKNFKENSIYKILFNFFDLIFQIFLSQLKILGLVYSRIIGSIMSFLYLYNKIKLNIFFSKLNFKTLFENKKYVINYVPNVFINHISTNALNFTLPITFGVFQLGLYSFVTRVLFGPVSIITASLQQVFFKEIADYNNQNKSLENFFINFYLKAISVLVLPVFLISFFSEEIIFYLFGYEWVEASTYIIAFAPFFILNSCNSSFSSIFVVKNKINSMLKLEFFFMTLKFSSIFILFWYEVDVKIFITFFGVLLFITSLITSIFFFNISKND